MVTTAASWVATASCATPRARSAAFFAAAASVRAFSASVSYTVDSCAAASQAWNEASNAWVEASYVEMSVSSSCGPPEVSAVLNVVSSEPTVSRETTKAASRARALSVFLAALTARERAVIAADFDCCQARTAPLYASEACSAAMARSCSSCWAAARSAWIWPTDRSVSVTRCWASITACLLGTTGSSGSAMALGRGVTSNAAAAHSTPALIRRVVDNVGPFGEYGRLSRPSPAAGVLRAAPDRSHLWPHWEHLSQKNHA